MKSILGFLYRNALNGWIKMSRYDEVVRKILAAGPV
jgi:hypothetical protein